MKRLLLIAAITSVCATTWAQNYTITEGKEDGLTSFNDVSNKFGENDKCYFICNKEGKKEDTKYTISKIDKTSLKKEWVQDAKFSDFKYQVPMTYLTNLFTPVYTGNKILLFVKYFDKPKQEVQLFMKIMTLDGATEKDWTQLGAMHSDILGIEGRQFYCVKSPDNSKFVIVSEFKWPKKPQVVTAQFYDISTMKEIGDNITFDDGYGAAGISSENYMLDNAGNLSFLFYYLAQATDETISLGIGIYPYKTKNLKVVELPLEQGKVLANYIVTTTKDGKVMYSGFFKDAVVKHSKKELKAGIYNYVIDLKGTLVSSDIQYFPDEVDAKLHYQDGLVEAPTGKKYFSLKSVTEMDGAYYLFANHNYTISDGKTSTTIEREFVVTKFNAKGKIEWINVYPKYTRDRLNAFNMMVHNHKIYVFYLEHPTNLEKSDLQDYDAKRYHAIKDYHGSVMVGLELNADGTASRKSIAETKDWFYDPSSVNTLLEKENSLLLRMVSGKKVRFDILTIE